MCVPSHMSRRGTILSQPASRPISDIQAIEWSVLHPHAGLLLLCLGTTVSVCVYTLQRETLLSGELNHACCLLRSLTKKIRVTKNNKASFYWRILLDGELLETLKQAFWTITILVCPVASTIKIEKALLQANSFFPKELDFLPIPCLQSRYST